MSRASRYRARYLDPDGERYGLPTYPWRSAPEGLATRRQLRNLGLRPGGQAPVAQVMWRRYQQDAVAYLYDIARAAPKRTATPAQWTAIRRAVAARRYCRTCQQDAGYVLPRRWGMCVPCAEAAGLLAA